MITEIKKRIWGISYDEIFSDDYLIWRFQIRNPFKKDNKWWIGVGEKVIREAQMSGVNKFIIQVGQRELMISVPDIKELKRKDKAKEYEMRDSLFEGSPAMKIYYFKI